LPNEVYEKYIICGADDCNKKSFIEHCKMNNINCLIPKNQFRKISVLDFFYFFELIKIFKHHKFDIIHTNSTKPGLLGRIAAKISRISLVIHTVHGISFYKSQSLFKKIFFYFLEVFATFFCDYIVLVNKYYSKYYRWIPFIKFITIYNGLIFDNCPKIVLNNNNKLKRLLFLGRFEKQKDPMTLLMAINLIKNLNKNLYNKIEVKMFGEGNLENDCKEFIIKNNLNISLSSWTKDKWSEFSKSDILCMPSLHEAFGLVFVEAGYCQIPIISTNVEGIPEVVVNGKSGLLCEPKNPRLLAKNIIKILEDSEYGKSLGKFGYEYVRNKFDFSSSLAEYHNLYQNLLIK
jgi:glycosyltransferase involved in cell wall biosynthesis